MNIYRISKRIIAYGIWGVSLVFVSSIAQAAPGGINQQIPYTAFIVNSSGGVLADGNYRARFVIWDSLTGGTQLYEETRDGIINYGNGICQSVPVNDGRLQILLGSCNTTLPSILNDTTLFLELQLDIDANGVYEEIFTPRRQLGSAVSAINSLRLVADGNGASTNTLSIDSTGQLVFGGGGNINLSNIFTTNNAGLAATINATNVTIGASTSSNTRLRITSTSGTGSGIWLNGASGTDTVGLIGGVGSTSNLGIYTSGLERVRIDPNGNIGLGTTVTSAARLTLADHTTIAGGIRFRTATTAVGLYSRGSNILTTPNVFEASSYNVGTTNIITTGRLLLTADGAVGTPSHSFSTDPNTGMYRIGNDILGFATNGLNRLSILSDGSTVIGNGDTAATPAIANLRGSNASGTNIAGPNFTITGGRGTGTGVGGDIILSTAPAGSTGATLNNAIERLRITASGNIGLGNITPTHLLDINSDTFRLRTPRTPASASATCVQGEISWDVDYIYVCTATNTWRRSAITTW